MAPDDKAATYRRSEDSITLVPPASLSQAPGSERCFYTLWGYEEEKTWEDVPRADLIDSIVPGTGRQDWRLIRPFDILPVVQGAGEERRRIYEGEALRISAAHIVGPQNRFDRAADHDTIFVQFAGYGLVETGFGLHEIGPGEALFIPAMCAHRTIGSRNCRRMEYSVRDRVDVRLDPAKPGLGAPFRVHPDGETQAAEHMPDRAAPEGGRIREHLYRWDDRPGEDFWFVRTHAAMVGGAQGGRCPVKVSPFDDFLSSAPPSPKTKAPVRTHLLWENATFRQRIYANPGRQPAPHRGYDEEELWFQMTGPIGMEGEHGAYEMVAGECSMAEAGISHTTISRPGIFRFTTYTPKQMRLVVEPQDHLRHTRWIVEEVR